MVKELPYFKSLPESQESLRNIIDSGAGDAMDTSGVTEASGISLPKADYRVNEPAYCEAVSLESTTTPAPENVWNTWQFKE